jgi:hypothetical protein
MVLKSIVAMGSVFFLAPFFLPFLWALTPSLSLSDIADSAFSPIHLFVSILSLIAGVNLVRHTSWMSFWSLTAVFMFGIEAFYMTFLGPERGVALFSTLLILFIWVVSFIAVYRLTHLPHIRPRIHWWIDDPRLKVALPAELRYKNRQLKGQILDINVRGCFIKLFERIPIHQNCEILFKVFQEDFHLNGVVTRQLELGVTHPRGIGIQFLIKKKSTRRKLKRLAKNILDLRKLYSKSDKQQRIDQLDERFQKSNKD